MRLAVVFFPNRLMVKKSIPKQKNFMKLVKQRFNLHIPPTQRIHRMRKCFCHVLWLSLKHITETTRQ
ncbi:hypothetical protein CJZ33_22580, partial [Salmonella enterica subsp. enterica serovar Schwarzengrund]